MDLCLEGLKNMRFRDGIVVFECVLRVCLPWQSFPLRTCCPVEYVVCIFAPGATALHPLSLPLSRISLEKALWVLRFLVRFAVEDLVFRSVCIGVGVHTRMVHLTMDVVTNVHARAASPSSLQPATRTHSRIYRGRNFLR